VPHIFSSMRSRRFFATILPCSSAEPIAKHPSARISTPCSRRSPPKQGPMPPTIFPGRASLHAHAKPVHGRCVEPGDSARHKPLRNSGSRSRFVRLAPHPPPGRRIDALARRDLDDVHEHAVDRRVVGPADPAKRNVGRPAAGERRLREATNTSRKLNESYGYLWWLNGKASYRLPSGVGGVLPEMPGRIAPGHDRGPWRDGPEDLRGAELRPRCLPAWPVRRGGRRGRPHVVQQSAARTHLPGNQVVNC